MEYITNIADAKQNFYKIVDMVLDNETIVHINNETGNIVLISENLYHSLIETLYLTKNSEYKQTLINSLKENIKDLFDEKDVKF